LLAGSGQSGRTIRLACQVLHVFLSSCLPGLGLQAEEAAKLAAQQEAKAMRRRADELEVGAGVGLGLPACI
jgi:hypothetical protein